MLALSLYTYTQIGLLYDNLIVGYGWFIRGDALLKLLSQPRFFVHEVVLVMLILVVDYIGRLAGHIPESSFSSSLLWYGHILYMRVRVRVRVRKEEEERHFKLNWTSTSKKKKR